MNIEDEKIEVPSETPVLQETPKPKKEKAVRVRKPNPWVNHVRSIAQKEGISYKQALSKAKATYKKE